MYIEMELKLQKMPENRIAKRKDNFKIRDVETKKDITSSILTQIVLDRETTGTNLIPEEFLKQIILFYEKSGTLSQNEMDSALVGPPGLEPGTNGL